jgi:23S rRNA (guanosine2251-2'-O)-methyltransferase
MVNIDIDMAKRKKFPREKHAGHRVHRPYAADSAAADRRTEANPSPALPQGQPRGSGYWLFGAHAVTEALRNPRRRPHRLLYTAEAAGQHQPLLKLAAARPQGAPSLEQTDRETIGRILPSGAVHQGLAVQVEPLPALDILDVCADLTDAGRAVLVLLDQVTDPHNVGAVLRSAAAFGAAAVIVTERNAAPESGVLAKAASGALEHVPLVHVTNLARAMEIIKKSGFWCVGLAADAPQSLAAADLTGRIALVLGSEGSGLRRLTREHCDLLVRLPTQGPIGQINVSNAAAIALYELARGAELPRVQPGG